LRGFGAQSNPNEHTEGAALVMLGVPKAGEADNCHSAALVDQPLSEAVWVLICIDAMVKAIKDRTRETPHKGR
jgi:hypothetical protein